MKVNYGFTSHRFIRLEITNDSPKVGSRETNAVVMARLLQALTAICPSLNKCFTLSKISGLTITNVKWQTVCDRLREEATAVWMIWVDCYGERLKAHLKHYLNESVEGLRINTIISEWEKVVIEEEGEEGRRIKSEILVPYQPSVSLQKFLAAVTRDLNKIVPHTVPRKVMGEFSNRVVMEVFGHYGEVSRGEGLRQKPAFQVLLDVKYVTMLLVPRENKAMGDRSLEICNRVLGKVDPFDSDVFYPFIQVNVKKSVQRTLVSFWGLKLGFVGLDVFGKGKVVPGLESGGFVCKCLSVLGGESGNSAGVLQNNSNSVGVPLQKGQAHVIC